MRTPAGPLHAARRLAPRRPSRRARRRVLAALALAAASFAAGYTLAVRVIFPPPDAPATVRVPALAGRPLEEARRTLEARGLVLGDTLAVPHPDAPAGTVIAQSPLPGQRARPGARVDVGVSAGPARLRVPELAGLPATRAATILRRAGLEVEEDAVPAELPAGLVVRTEPAAGAELPPRARLRLLVSAGAPPAETTATPPDTAAPPDTSGAPRNKGADLRY